MADISIHHMHPIITTGILVLTTHTRRGGVLSTVGLGHEQFQGWEIVPMQQMMEEGAEQQVVIGSSSRAWLR